MKRYALHVVFAAGLCLSLLVVSFLSVQAGIVPAIIPAAAPTANKTGTGQRFTTSTAAGVNGNCPIWTAAGDIGDSGGTCVLAGTITFAQINSGTNTTAALHVGTGAALDTSGTGTIFANGIRAYTVGTLPGSPTTGQQAFVTDGVSTTDCITGGGAIQVLCAWSGSAWIPEGGGGSGLLLSGATDPGVPATPTVVQANAANLSGTSGSVIYSSNVTAGNISAVSVTCNGGTLGAFTISDTRGTSYSQLSACNGVGSQTDFIYTGVLGSSGSNTVSYSGASCSGGGLLVQEINGSNGVLDVHACGAPPPAVTTTQISDLLLIVQYSGSGGGQSGTPPTVVDAQAHNAGNSQVVAHLPTTSAGTYTPAISNPGSSGTSLTAAIEPIPVTSPGVNGSFYVNTTTGVLWGPKAGGTWNKSTLSFINQTGSNNHFVLGGTAPVVSACGSAPSGSLVAGSTDTAGTITAGGGSVTSCTLTFGTAFTRAPGCSINSSLTTSTPAVSTTTTAATFTFSSSINGATLSYNCF